MNTLDAYRLAKYLRGHGEQIDCLDTVFARYTEPVLLHESGFTVFMLKTTGADDTCIFLKDNRCTIQQTKPTACRLYPFAVEPAPDGGYKYLLSTEKTHHFKGGQVEVRRWIKQNFNLEDREFMRIDMDSAPVIAFLLRNIPVSEQKHAIMLYLWYRFSDFGKVHFCFASYDMKLPADQRQTNSVHIYVAVDEFLGLCQKMASGELRYMMQQRKKEGSNDPLYKCLGGTSAEKLKKLDRARPDGMSLSRTAELLCGKNADFLFVANSGPGESNKTGLIVPRFGNKPENHVSVSMTWDNFAGLMLTTKAHYEAWLAAKYVKESKAEKRSSKPKLERVPKPAVEIPPEPEYSVEPEYGAVAMF